MGDKWHLDCGYIFRDQRIFDVSQLFGKLQADRRSKSGEFVEKADDVRSQGVAEVFEVRHDSRWNHPYQSPRFFL
jgi:hypothetical protein